MRIGIKTVLLTGPLIGLLSPQIFSLAYYGKFTSSFGLMAYAMLVATASLPFVVPFALLVVSGDKIPEQQRERRQLQATYSYYACLAASLIVYFWFSWAELKPYEDGGAAMALVAVLFYGIPGILTFTTLGALIGWSVSWRRQKAVAQASDSKDAVGELTRGMKFYFLFSGLGIWLLVLSLGFKLFPLAYLFVYLGVVQSFGSANFLLRANLPKGLIAAHLAIALLPAWLIFSHTAGFLIFGRDIGDTVLFFELSIVIFGPISQGSAWTWIYNKVRPNSLTPGYSATGPWWIIGLVMLFSVALFTL